MSSNGNWLAAYTSAMSRAPPPKAQPGVHCCAICCTIFSLVGALFLFILGGLMNSHYPYIHIPGDTAVLSQQTIYAGLIYLLCAVVSIGFWIRGSYRSGVLQRKGQAQFSQLK